jgi:dipeptidyl aminopeptidase/acylaminoacyl peptidase
LGGSGIVAASEPYPLEYYALPDVMRNVIISPNGEHLLLLSSATDDGAAVLEIYDAANLRNNPYRVSADPMEIRSAQWASDDDILLTLRQKVKIETDDSIHSVFQTRIARLGINKRAMKTFEEVNAVIENILPHDPDKIIISMQPGTVSDEGAHLEEAFRPRVYYLFDLSKDTKSLLIRGTPELGNIDFDEYGQPWLARGFDHGVGEYVWYRRYESGKEWREFYGQSEDLPESFTVEGLDPDDKDSLLVTARNGHDKAGLWTFNTRKKQFGELIYRRNDVDISGTRMHSNRWTEKDTIVGVAYQRDTIYYEYFDVMEAATYEQLKGLIPNAHKISILSRSRDGQTMTVLNSGPHDPGSYYLIKDAALQKVGSRQPLLFADRLADVEYITYESRDGKMIPGFVTRPHGEGPFPLVVMPHDGPFVAETVYYDERAQMLANNGYLVLQPQYRGSWGYGVEHYLAAIEGGGQGGYKMQDDKDDGALYLVEQGLVDDDRMAMFGWSYGGYAALVAASRTPQIYQCVIAGAAVNDTLMQVNNVRDELRGHRRDQQLAMWTDSISPMEEVENVNVPILLVHGSADQQVLLAYTSKYVKLLEEYGKDYEFVELDGADHHDSTMLYEHRLELYESIIDFLHNDCGPGGL